MRYTIRHETRCRFDSPAGYSIRNLRLTPREEGAQHVEQWQLAAPAPCARRIDAWGNTTHLLTLTEPHDEVRIIVSGVVEMSDAMPAILAPRAEDLAPLTFLAASQLTTPSAPLDRFAKRHLGSAELTPAHLLGCIDAIKERISLAPAGGQAILGAAEAFERGHGALHDQVHTFITLCRLAGLPARFVSGLHLGDSATEHAWADVWLPSSASWHSFDIRRSRLADGRLIRLAIGRDYLDACPMRAARLGGGEEEVRVTVHAH